MDIKPPTLNEIVENAEKASSTYEKKPWGTSFYVVVVVMGVMIIALIYFVNKMIDTQNENSKLLIQSAIQNKTIKEQERAIDIAIEAKKSDTLKTEQ